jgi:hypothetical protein
MTLFEQDFWFLLDHHSLTLSQVPGTRALDPSVRTSITMYTRWLPLNPELSSIGRLLLNQVLCFLDWNE